MNGTADGGPRRGVIRRILDKIDERVGAPVDDDARRRGLTVTPIPGTRTHRYRFDALWDRRQLCGECFGAGQCIVCGGHGVVTVDVTTPMGELR